MAAYCQVYGVIHFMSPAGRLPVHRDQLRAQRSVTEYGKLYLYFYYIYIFIHRLGRRNMLANKQQGKYVRNTEKSSNK